MQKRNQYLLVKDIHGSARHGKAKLYGRKGARVTEISDHDNVLIVEDQTGERFPVHKSNLQPLNSNS